jgi:muramoyltetrapeptide carboxypeptidase LdcA involved in peptidoglycan recycling
MMKAMPRSGPAGRQPPAVFGYSDKTSLQLFLWNLGLVSYLGGSIGETQQIDVSYYEADVTYQRST